MCGVCVWLTVLPLVCSALSSVNGYLQRVRMYVCQVFTRLALTAPTLSLQGCQGYWSPSADLKAVSATSNNTVLGHLVHRLHGQVNPPKVLVCAHVDKPPTLHAKQEEDG